MAKRQAKPELAQGTRAAPDHAIAERADRDSAKQHLDGADNYAEQITANRTGQIRR